MPVDAAELLELGAAGQAGPRSPWAWSPWQRAQPSPLRENACRPAAAAGVPLASATSSRAGAGGGLGELAAGVDADPWS